MIPPRHPPSTLACIASVMLTAQTPKQAPPESFFRDSVPTVALACADRALALGKGKGEYHLLRAEAFAAESRRADAETALAEARRLDPKDVETHLGAARTYLRLGDRGAARNAVEAALATAPQSPEPCYLAARLWRSAGDLEAVRILAAKALPLVAKDAGVAGAFAVELMDAGLAPEAFALIEAAHSKAPKDWEICTNFGAACLRARRPTEAATWFQHGLLARPAEENSRQAMMEAYFAHGTKEDCTGAREALMSAVAVAFPAKTRDPQALALIGHLHLCLGEREVAEARFREAVMHKQVGAEAFRLIGRAWLQAGFEAEAFRAYDVVSKGQGVGPQFGFGAGGSSPAPGASPQTPGPVFTNNPGVGPRVSFQPGAGGSAPPPGVSSQAVRPVFTFDLATINRKRAIFDAAMDLATAGHKARAIALAEEAYLSDPDDFENMATFGRKCLQKGWREEAAHFLALGGKTRYKDRDYWSAVGQALLETLPPPPVAARPNP